MVSLADKIPRLGGAPESGCTGPSARIVEQETDSECKEEEGYDFLDGEANDILLAEDGDNDIEFSDWNAQEMKSQLQALFHSRQQQIDDLKQLRNAIHSLEELIRRREEEGGGDPLNEFNVICDNCYKLKPCMETIKPCASEREHVLICLDCLKSGMDGSWYHNSTPATDLELTNRHIAHLTHTVIGMEEAQKSAISTVSGHFGRDSRVPAVSLVPPSPTIPETSPVPARLSTFGFGQVSIEELTEPPIEEDSTERRQAVDALHKSWIDLLHLSALTNRWDQLFALGILDEDDRNDLIDTMDKDDRELSNMCLLTIIQAKPYEVINSFLEFAEDLQKKLRARLQARSRSRARSISPTQSSADPELSARSRLGPAQLSGRIHMPTRSPVAATYTWKLLMHDPQSDKLKLWRGLDAIGFLELTLKLVGHRHGDNGIEVTVLKGYNFRCWSRLGKNPKFGIYVKCFVTFEGDGRQADKMKTQHIEPRREPVFGSVLKSPLQPRYIDQMRQLQVQIWEYSGLFHRRLPVASACIDLVRLRLDSSILGTYAMFVPPPSPLEATSVGGEPLDRSLSIVKPEFADALYRSMTPVSDADSVLGTDAIDGLSHSCRQEMSSSRFSHLATTAVAAAGGDGDATTGTGLAARDTDHTHASMVVQWNSSGDERDDHGYDDNEDVTDSVTAQDDVIAAAADSQDQEHIVPTSFPVVAHSTSFDADVGLDGDDDALDWHFHGYNPSGACTM